MTLHILRGISGSGKTTFAKSLAPAVRISRDDIRAELMGNNAKFAGDNAFENKVTKVQTEMVRELLINRKDVVIDDTNLQDKYVQRWIDMAQDYGHEYVVHQIQVTLEDALHQNRNRPIEDRVPEDVIRKQYQQTLHNNQQGLTKFNTVYPTHPFVDWSPYVPDTSLPLAVGVDLDGTLAHMPPGFNVYDPAHYPHDSVDPLLLGIVNHFSENGHALIVLTGRDESHRQVVETWLQQNNVLWDHLVMRPEGDKRRDDVVKADLFNYYVRDRFNFKLQWDDRQRVVDMWRKRGILCHQVANGDF